jgi:hypothetical protein
MSLAKAILGKMAGRGKAACGEEPRKNAASSRFVFYEFGFHGDRYLLQLADHLLGQADAFIETGGNVGSTLAYVARRFPKIDAFSSEPDEAAFAEAIRNIEGLANAVCVKAPSPASIETLIADRPDLLERPTVFWLDAHGYGFEWPLRDEIALITERFRLAALLIDDFRVPGRDGFKWDRYGGHECSFDYIRESLAPNRDYRLYYPTYEEKTSPHHPLTGWGLLDCGFGADLIEPFGDWLEERPIEGA